VLQVLTHFVSEAVSPANQVTNRMSVENFSIVLAPCLLRSGAGTEDPMQQLLNSKFEIKFVSMILQGTWMSGVNAPAMTTSRNNMGAPGEHME
jgi:hypothetical protein